MPGTRISDRCLGRIRSGAAKPRVRIVVAVGIGIRASPSFVGRGCGAEIESAFAIAGVGAAGDTAVRVVKLSMKAASVIGWPRPEYGPAVKPISRLSVSLKRQLLRVEPGAPGILLPIQFSITNSAGFSEKPQAKRVQSGEFANSRLGSALLRTRADIVRGDPTREPVPSRNSSPLSGNPTYARSRGSDVSIARRRGLEGMLVHRGNACRTAREYGSLPGAWLGTCARS